MNAKLLPCRPTPNAARRTKHRIGRQIRITVYSPQRQQQSVSSAVSRWLRDIVISLVVSAFFIVFLYQPVKVEGTSMMPTLEDQERVFINKFVYRLEPIQRGDVVVFRYPRDTSKSYIKRVIALPGDRVRIDDGLVYVNDHQIPEEYVPQM